MAIDPRVIAHIKESANVVEVIGDYVSLKRKGANYWGCCPFHHEKTPSFSVSAVKNMFYCFGCQKGGDSVKFLMEHNALSYHDALVELAKKYHIEVVEKEESEDERRENLERESLLNITAFAAKHFEHNLHETEEGRAVGLSYLMEKRGFTEESIRTFHLGYALDSWDDLYNSANDIQKELLPKAGLTELSKRGTYIDNFRGRVIFPFFSDSGQIIAFTARLLVEDTKGVRMKYKNSPDNLLFKKSNEIYGFNQAQKAIQQADCVYMVEGQADVISLHQNGIKNVVCCSGGKGLSEAQAHKMGRLTKNIILMYDSDGAGERDTVQAIDVALQWGFNIGIVQLPDEQDPDEFARRHNADEVKAYLTENKVTFYEYKCQQVLRENDPIKRVSLIREKLIPTLALVTDRIMLNEYIRICSQRINWREEDLLHEIDKEIKRQAEEKERQQHFAEIEAERERKIAEREREKAQQEGMPDMPPPEYDGQDIPPEYDYTDTETTQEKKPSKADFQKTSDPRYNKFEALEFQILQFAIRQGNEPIFADEKGQPITVNEFIVDSFLESDDIKFKNPIYQSFLYELAAHLHDEGFNPERFFSTHPDLNISNLAIALMSDKYILSKLFTIDSNSPKIEGNTPKERNSAQERLNKYLEKKRAQMLQALGDELDKTVLEYKALIISEKIQQVTLELKQASELGDNDQIMQLMNQITMLNKQKNRLSEALGGRIIIKMG